MAAAQLPKFLLWQASLWAERLNSLDKNLRRLDTDTRIPRSAKGRCGGLCLCLRRRVGGLLKNLLASSLLTAGEDDLSTNWRTYFR